MIWRSPVAVWVMKVFAVSLKSEGPTPETVSVDVTTDGAVEEMVLVTSVLSKWTAVPEQVIGAGQVQTPFTHASTVQALPSLHELALFGV